MTTPPEALREMGEIFDEAANHLECAMLALGSALEKRIKNLDETIADDEAALTHHKEAARFLHGRIAGFRAERARIAAQTGLDLLRAVVAERPRAEVEQMADAAEQKPPLFDLRTVAMGPDGDVVVADADLCDANSTVALVRKGESFFVERTARTTESLAGAPFPRVKVEVRGTGYQCFIAAMQPAHVEPRKPALLDLCGLKVGTVCEAREDVVSESGQYRIAKGRRFRIRSHRDDSGMVHLPGNDFSYMWVDRMQPAHVVEEPT